MADRGIVYVATKHDRYVEEAFLSANSIKQFCPELPVTLFTDLPENALCTTDTFDRVEPITGVTGFASGWAEGQLNRLSCLPKSPYKRTLHLDSDTRVKTADVRNLFELLDTIDVAMVETAVDASYSRKEFGRRMFSAGFVLYRQSPDVAAWLDAWINISEDYFRKAGETPLPQIEVLNHIADESIRRKLLCMDQTSLVTILSPDINIYKLQIANLDYSWNYAGSRLPENNRAAVKILHTPILKTTTLSDILLDAERASHQGNDHTSKKLYDYVAGKIPRQIRRRALVTRIFGAKTVTNTPEQWLTPRLMQADLHQRFGQLGIANKLLTEAKDDPAALPYAAMLQAQMTLSSGMKQEATALATYAYGLKPESPFLAIAWGAILIATGHYREATPPLQAALKKGFPEAGFQLGQAFFNLGDYHAAAAAYRAALEIDSENMAAANNLMPALLGARDYDGALKQANSILRESEWNTAALAFKCVALAELGHTSEEKALVDFESLVMAKKMSPPQNFRTLEDFNTKLSTAFSRETSLAHAPPAHATRNGWHSGDLSASQDPTAIALRDAILSAVGERHEAISSNGNNLFERHRPSTYRLYSWAVIMEDQGHQIPHIHAHGWMSGVYYIQVPPDVRPDDPTRAGWLVFGPSEPRWHRQETHLATHYICPTPGLLVTFPSYFWHSTVPLRSRKRRISYAFDVIPA